MKSRSLAALGMTMLSAAAHAQTTDVALGIEALARRDVKGAEAAFRRGTTADNPLIRPAAWQWLGHVAWKFRGDTTVAKQYLDRALGVARDSSQILLEIARLHGARRHFREGQRLAYEAMRRSGDGERRGLAARAVVELAVDGAFAGRRAQLRDSADFTVLRAVRDTLRSRASRFPGRTVDARALIDAGAILGDSSAVRAGLRSYFALDGGVGRVYRGDQSILSDLLKQAGLHESAALYLRGRNADLTVAEWADEVAYANFLRDLRAATEQVYRASLAGRARVGDINRAITAHGRALWRELHLPLPRPAFYPAALLRFLADKFGARISVERSRGIDELHLSHRLRQEASDGRVVLDGIVESGIDNWLLDGTGGRAGWVAGDTIFERRTGFTETPYRALLALTDPQTIPGELFRVGRDSVADFARAKSDSLGYLPGVAARVFRAGAQALLDSVKTTDAFLVAMYNNLVQSSIVLHEGRHRADARARLQQSEADAEFRAKLDEVTGARLPRLALTAILSPSIGDGSPHGQANRRIMIGLNRWIRRNGSAISGYDARVPALLQLPLLTDGQLKAAFNSMRVR